MASLTRIAGPARRQILTFAQARQPIAFSTAQWMRSTPENPNRDLEVGELQGAKFKIEPLRRTGEDEGVTRARLLCRFRNPPCHSKTIHLL
jgi:hypothetical protein